MPETTTPVTAAPAGRFAASAQPLLVVDDDCVCVEASLGACRLLGCSRGEVVGRPVVDLLEADSRERFGHIWRAFREGGGQAEPFALDVPATVVRVGITVTAGILPHRHLIRFDPTAGGLPPVSEPLASSVAADNGAGPQVSPADSEGAARRPVSARCLACSPVGRPMVRSRRCSSSHRRRSRHTCATRRPSSAQGPGPRPSPWRSSAA